MTDVSKEDPCKPICPDDDEREKLKTLLELVKMRYSDELQRSVNLDNKAAQLVGFITVATGLLIGLGALETFPRLQDGTSAVYSFYIGLAFLLGSIITAIFTIWTRRWRASPASKWTRRWVQDKKLSRDRGFNHTSVLLRTIIIMSHSVEHNFSNNENKALLLTIATILLVIGISVLVVFLGLYIATVNS